MRVTARADYAVRAAIELVGSSAAAPRKADSIAVAQGIPLSFLENILNQLKSAGVVRSQRGPDGGWWLLKAPESLQVVWIALRANIRSVLERVTLADVASGQLPKQVVTLTREQTAWKSG